MLQRIQTIWLFLAGACALLSIKFPIYSGAPLNTTVYQEITGTVTIPILILTVAIGVLAFIAIFMYANRKLQFRLCLIGIILQAILIFLYYTKISEYETGTFSLTAILHALVLLFFFFAARGIRADDRIVRESNRLR
ncbi:MAG: DUF4293 family protein [Chitinophagaceae bacterium]|nr:MAG: DUF4293 family protein [Chitinophagaceae bacterium]